MFHCFQLRRHGHLLGLFLCLLAGIGCELPTTMRIAGTNLPGDVDGNGSVDIWDARSLDRSLTSQYFRVPNPDCADVSQNSKLDRGDFEAIQKRAQGLSTVEINVNADNQMPVVIGGVSSIVVADTFLPLNVNEGSVRITSQAAGYDSGECKLYHASHGRSLYYHWNTAGLLPANDYVIEVQLQKSLASLEAESPVDEAREDQATEDDSSPADTKTTVTSNASTVLLADRLIASVSDLVASVDASETDVESLELDESVAASNETAAADGESLEEATPEPSPAVEITKNKVQVSLIARARELPVLAEFIDLSLPYWDLDLQVARQYRYSAFAEPDISEFGRGWTHAYGLRLVEHTDGSIELLGVGPHGPHFVKTETGVYREVTGLAHKVVRDPDGSFQLITDDHLIWRFDASLTPLEVDDGQGHRVSLQYEEDRLVKVSDLSGQFLQFNYADELVESVSDSAGRTVQFQYDQNQNLVLVTRPAGEEIAYVYDDQQRLSNITRNDTIQRELAYYDDGLVRSIKGESEVLELDYSINAIGAGARTIKGSAGEILSEKIASDGRVLSRGIGADSHAVQFEYDDQFTLCKLTGLDNTVWKSVPEDSQTQLTFPGGAEMTWKKVPEQSATIVTDANGISTTLRYLEDGQLTHIQYPDGLTEVRRYFKEDDGTSIQRELRSGQKVQYWFDKRGLLQSMQINRQPKVVYQYDAVGNLTQATNGWGTLSFEYDESGRLTACKYPNGKSLVYTYDRLGRKESLASPGGQLVYSYDPAGRLRTLALADEMQLAEYVYDEVGLKSRRTANGVLHQFEYDRLGQVKSVVSESPSKQTLAARDYEYDNLSRITKVAIRGGQSKSFAYDSAGRLVTVKNGDEDRLSIAYDAVNNRTALSTKPVKANVLNQYSSTGDSTRFYDLDGNLNAVLQADKKTAYEHDSLGRLVRVRLPNQVVVSYQYDPLGRLASRTIGSQVTHFFWDGDRIVYSENNGGNDPRLYVWAPRLHTAEPSDRELVAMRRDATWHYCWQDAIGNVSEITDTEGQIVSSPQTDCFGNVIAGPDADVELPFRFKGAFYDSQTDLHYIHNRWYESSTATFLEPDQLATLSGQHPYAIAGCDPINGSRLQSDRWADAAEQSDNRGYDDPTNALWIQEVLGRYLCRSVHSLGPLRSPYRSPQGIMPRAEETRLLQAALKDPLRGLSISR
ncbi:RHS repeat-associated core domain-containing protein [Novipirellula caenicola]|uniref:Teneurin-like YD-shell domain-containing protein n=1 Tax=Novipirellula caenicola TaxID=1536901 RepID=A0ABP9VVB2_9BACT